MSVMACQTHPNQTMIVGISGASSCGKTTLARILRTVFTIPPSDETDGRSITLSILHEDDFYAADEKVPIVTTQSALHGIRKLPNWEGVEAIDINSFGSTLNMIKQTGNFPESFVSKEDLNNAGQVKVADEQIEACGAGVRNWLRNLQFSAKNGAERTKHLNICIVEGWLLYQDPSNTQLSATVSEFDPSPTLSGITALMDVKLFIRSTRSQTVSRRGCWPGYVTQEGFQTDPPGYVEEIVWPTYEKEHSWMFERGDVEEGEVKNKAENCANTRERILVTPGKGVSAIAQLLDWSVGSLTEALTSIVENGT